MRKFQRKIKVKMGEGLRAALHYNMHTMLAPESHNAIDTQDTLCMLASIWSDIEGKLGKSLSARKKSYHFTFKYHEAYALVELLAYLNPGEDKPQLMAAVLQLVSDIHKQLV